jgi:hypothetical protein
MKLDGVRETFYMEAVIRLGYAIPFDSDPPPGSMQINTVWAATLEFVAGPPARAQSL